jgi:hypothetical protein
VEWLEGDEREAGEETSIYSVICQSAGEILHPFRIRLYDVQ